MAKYSNVIEYNIKTTLDKSGLSQLQNELRQLELSMQRASDRNLLDPGKVVEARQQLQGLNNALSKSFNSSIGMLDLSKLRKELNDCQVDMNKLGTAFQLGGVKGQVAFNNLIKQIGTFDTGIKNSSAMMNKMFNTISNTVRWGIVSSGFSQILDSLHQSVDYIKELDESLTQIMLVTDYSREQMNEYAKSANDAAKALGNTTVGMTNASLVFAQQGYDLNQSQQLAELSVKLANASQQDTATASDQITAYMNAYGLDSSIENLKSALDAWAEVANVSAADVQELAAASQKAASTAKVVGITTDQLNAQIAAIESVTREAPEQIGNGLKTIYARFSDLSLGKDLEDGVDLGKVTGVLNQIGVEVLDTAGKMRSVGDIMEDLMKVWQETDDTHRAAIAQTVAGKYQVGRFEALMSRSDLYDQYLEASKNSEGTLDEMQAERIESLEGKTKQLQATWEGLISNIVNSDDFYKFIDVIKGFVEGIDTFVESVGGGTTALLGLASTLTKVFSNSIGNLINNKMQNLSLDQIKAKNIAESSNLLSDLGVMPQAQNEDTAALMSFYQNYGSQAEKFSPEQLKQFSSLVGEWTENINEAALAEEKLKNLAAEASAAIGTITGDFDSIFKQLPEDGGIYNVANYLENLTEIETKQLQNLGLDTAIEEMTRFNKEIQQVSNSLADFGEGKISIEAVNGAIKEAGDSLILLKNDGVISKDTFNNFDGTLSKLRNNLKNLSKKEIEDFCNDLDKMTVESKNLVDILKDLSGSKIDIPKLRELLKQLQQAESKVESLNQKTEILKRTASGMSDSFSKQLNIKSIVEMTSALSQLGFAVQSIKNLGSIWSDEDLSAGDKFLQILTNVGIVASSLYSSFQTLEPALASMAASVSSLLTQVFLDKVIAAKGNLTIANEAVTASEKKLAAAQTASAAMEERIVVLSAPLLAERKALIGQHEQLILEYEILTKKIKAHNDQNVKYHMTTSQLRKAQKRKAEVEAELAGIEGKLLTIDEQLSDIEARRVYATTGLTVAKEANAKATEEQAAAEAAFLEIQNMVNVSSTQMLGVLGAVAVAIGLIAAAIQADIEAKKQALENAIEEYQEAKQALESFKGIEDRYEEFQALYDSWEKGETSASDLKTKCVELADSLEDVGLKALANADNFEEFNKKLDENIRKLKEENLQAEINASKKVIEKGEDAGALKYTPISESNVTNSSLPSYSGPNGVTSTFSTTYAGPNGVLSNTPIKDKNVDLSWLNDIIDPEMPYTFVLAKERLKKLADEAEEGSVEQEQYNKALEEITAKIEDNPEVFEASEKILVDSMQKNNIQDQLTELARIDPTNIEKIFNIIGTGNEELSAFFSNENITYAEKLKIALQGVADEAQRVALTLAQGLVEDHDFNEEETQDYLSRLKGLGLDSSQMITFTGTIDKEASKEEIETKLSELEEKMKEEGWSFEALAKINFDYSKMEELPTLQLEVDVEETREKYEDLWQAFEEDAKIGSAQIRDIFNENIQEAFDKASDQSNEAFGDAFSLLSDNTFNTQASGVKLKETLDDIDHSLKFQSIQEGKEALEELHEEVDTLGLKNLNTSKELRETTEALEEQRRKLVTTGDSTGELSAEIKNLEKKQRDLKKQTTNAVDGLEELAEKADELEDQSFNLSIDIGGDLIDQSNAIVEALEDVQDITGKIGEGFLVAADDVEALASAFPGILENYSITADGMIQLDGEIAKSQLGVATSDVNAVTEAQILKLKNYADYANTMADNYDQQAQALAKAATAEVVEEDAANALIYASENELTKQSQDLLNEKGLAASVEAENEVGYSEDAAQGMATSMQKGASSAETSISQLSQASKDAAIKMVEHWHQVADAVADAGSGNRGGDIEAMQAYDAGKVTAAADTSSDGNVHDRKDPKLYNGGGKTWKVTDPDGDPLMKKAQEYWAKAKALREGANRALAAAARQEANRQNTNNAIQEAGRPETPDIDTPDVSERDNSPKEEEPEVFEPDRKENVEDELDLYEKINTQLEDMESLISRIEQESDRLYGDKAHANMSKHITLLRREMELQERKLQIQKQEYDDLANRLIEYGVTFDSEGFIDNYSTVFRSLEDYTNELINRYNAAGSEEEQDRLSEEIDGAEAAKDEFEKLVQRYDELQGQELQETSNAIEELKNKIEDVRIEAYKASQEAIDNIKELNDQWAKLQGFSSGYEKDSPFRTIVEDSAKLKNIFGGAKDEVRDYYETLIQERQRAFNAATSEAEKQSILQTINFYKQQQARSQSNPSKTGSGALDAAFQDEQRLSEWLSNPSAKDNPFGENIEALRAALEEAFNRTIELAQEAEDHVNDLRDAILDGYKKIAEDAEEQIDKYDRIVDKLDQIADMTKLAYGEKAYAAQKKIYEQQAKTYMEQGRAQQQMLQILKNRYDALSKKDKVGEIGKQILEDMNKMEDRLLDIQKSAAEGFQKAFEAAIKKISADFTKKIFKGEIDRISDNWERDKTFAETYYDSVQRAGAIDKLRLKYIQLLNDSQNSGLLIQNRIRNSMKEQVKYLEDQRYLSEYNVKFANAQLEILQKQIALENARQNKNKMSLRRDAQGNYNYVYSADQSDINSKQSDLLDSELNAYDMSNENRMNIMSQALAAFQDFIAKREILTERMSQGDTEAVQALEQLTADFLNNMKGYSEELSDSWSGMVTSLEWLAQSGNENVSSMAEQAADAIINKNEEACAELGINTDTAVQSVLDNVSKLEKEVKKTNNQLMQEAKKYQDEITDPKDGVVTLVSDGFGNVSNAIKKASKETAGLTKETYKLKEALNSRDLALVDSMDKLQEYSNKLGDLQRQDSDIMRQWATDRDKLTAAEQQNRDWEVKFTSLDQLYNEEREKRRAAEERAATPVSNPTPTPAPYSPAPVYTGVDINRVIEVYNGIHAGRFSTAPSRRGLIVSAGYTEQEAEAGQKLINYHYPIEDAGEGMEWNAALDRIKREFGQAYMSVFASNNFDTGGYTGDWNSKDGKMAVLHQKELVLNASDTQNILNAVDMVRQMADLLKNKIEIPSLIKTNVNKNGINGETIQQRVEIKAEFPNVSTAEDIKTALLNLADSAYQYSYRTR